MKQFCRIIIAATVLLAFTPSLEARFLRNPGGGCAVNARKCSGVTKAGTARKAKAKKGAASKSAQKYQYFAACLNSKEKGFVGKALDVSGGVVSKSARKYTCFTACLKSREKGLAKKTFDALTAAEYNRKYREVLSRSAVASGSSYASVDWMNLSEEGVVRYPYQFKAEPMEEVQSGSWLDWLMGNRYASVTWRYIDNSFRAVSKNGNGIIDSIWKYGSQILARSGRGIKFLNKLQPLIDRFQPVIKIGKRMFSGRFNLLTSAFDIAYGIYMIYNAESRLNQGTLDLDLANYKKILGCIQIGIGVVGIVALFAPEMFSKIAAPIVLVAAILVVVFDRWIDYIQAQRDAARHRMAQRIKERVEPEAIHEYLLRMLN